jgi:DHA2 family multidrug resistance protein
MAVLSRNMSANHAYLTENSTAEALGLSWKTAPQALLDNGSGALVMLDAEITRQAATIAYINDFSLMMWVVVGAAPMVLLLRKQVAPPPAPPA